MAGVLPRPIELPAWLLKIIKLMDRLVVSAVVRIRENQSHYITVSAETLEGYNTTLLTRELNKKINGDSRLWNWATITR